MSSEVDAKGLEAAAKRLCEARGMNPNNWPSVEGAIKAAIQAYLSASPSIGRVGELVVPRPIDLPMEHWKGWDLCTQAYILAFREANREATAATLVYHEEPAGDTQGAGELPSNNALMPELPRPRVTFADHSYPAFSPTQMLDFASQSLNNLRAALVSPPDNGEPALLATMAKNLGWELDWGPRDANDEEGEHGWRVHERRGNRSDLEWTLIGFGERPIDALRRAALQSHNEGSAGK